MSKVGRLGTSIGVYSISRVADHVVGQATRQSTVLENPVLTINNRQERILLDRNIR